jgi:16S rRNA (adenine1518-N6/adenine1519-N6)-dimethyltransferase
MKRTLQEHTPRKRFGQNFLRDGQVVDRIIAAVQPRSDQHIVEIGPGEGALTESLVESGARLDVIELDRDLVPGLLAAYGLKSQFKLHNADALKFDYSSLLDDEESKLRIVGNLPYNISTPLIFKLLEQAPRVADMHFMLQLEVVQRLAAVPGSKQWGRLGIMAQYQCRIEHLFDVPPGAFYPPPKVQSAIVRFTPYTELPWQTVDHARFGTIVKMAFSQRRKTLRNNLKNLIDSQRLQALGIDPACRAETLELTQFIDIANSINDQDAI